MIDKKLTNQEIVAREWEKFQFENSAYSELKKWCEKHLKPEQFTIIPETESFLTTIYFNARNDLGVADYICFNRAGEYCGTGAVSRASKIEHFDEYENANEY